MKIQILPKKENNKTLQKENSDASIKQKYLSVPGETFGLDGYDMLTVHEGKLSQPVEDNKTNKTE